MKIIYAGSPEYAVPALEKIISSGREVVAVITQPDRPVGRKKVLTPTPVKVCAAAHGIPVISLPKIRAHVGEIAAFNADIMITCAYGQILSKEILQLFPLGVWNLHASLLPRFRGASPIQAAILAGEEYTGVTVMKTEESLDTGDILLVKRVQIGTKTCGELSAELSEVSADAAAEALEYIERGETQLLLQNEMKATYCRKVTKEDAKIDFSLPCSDIIRCIKAYSPEPCAYCSFNGSTLNILNADLIPADKSCTSAAGGADANTGADAGVNTGADAGAGANTGISAGVNTGADAGTDKIRTVPGTVLEATKRGIIVACADGAICITSLQPAGGRVMKAADFVNGRKIKAGDILE